MKLRKRQPLYVEEDNIEEEIKTDGKRIDPITNPLSDEGAFRLATAILEQTAIDYVLALKTIMKIEKRAKAIYQKIRKCDIWEYYQKEATNLLNKDFSKLDSKQSHIVVVASLIRKPPLPSTEEIEIYNEYIKAVQTKNECEQFYLSKKYQNLTLGKGLKSEEVIKKLKEKAGYKKVK